MLIECESKVLGKVWPGFKNKYDLDIYDPGWAELGAPGIPRGPHLFGFYVVKKLKM